MRVGFASTRIDLKSHKPIVILDVVLNANVDLWL